MKFSRRGFVKFSAGSAAGLGLAGVSLKTLSDLTAATTEENYPSKGPESFLNSICQLCPGGCGVTVRKVGDRVVRVQGNRNSPINRGGLCPIGVASLQYLYHPARLRSPLKREGSSWTKISWDSALGEIGSKLSSTVGRGEGSHVVMLSQELQGVLRQVASDFLGKLGSNNLIETSGPGDGTGVAVRLMQGVQSRPAYDLTNSNHILCIGCELLEGWSSPVWVMKGYSQFRGKRPRGRLTYAGSRQSVTATKADTAVQIRPGTEGLLALGIAYVLISERLYDFEFVQSHCQGFEDWRDENGRWHLGFRNMVLERYPLNLVSEVTEVPTERILKIAREFGGTRPALALAGPIDSVTANNILAALSVHALNALVGSIDRRGGVLLQYPDPLDTSEPAQSTPSFLGNFAQLLRLGKDPLEAVEQAFESGKPYLPSALITLDADPVSDSHDAKALSEKFQQVPLIVSVSSFLTATAQLAHYVLPSASFLESWVEQESPSGIPFLYHGLAQPATSAFAESRATGDILLGLTRSLGVPVSDEDYGALLKKKIAGLYERKSGAVAGTVFDQLWHQLMEQSGWWAPTYESPDQLVEQVAAKGGWWDSFYRYEDWSRTLRNPTGKFHFSVSGIESLVGGEAAGQLGSLPHFQPPAEGPASEKYHFLVRFFDPLVAVSHQPPLPFVREIAGGLVQNNAGIWVEINEADAEELGIHSGELVWVESIRNRLQVFARVSTGVLPGVVNIPRGVSGWSGDPWSVGSPVASATLAEHGADFMPKWGETRVRLLRS
ncbi:MAG: molybdopterin-dependent oxidoreductase [Acidobacteria bacterium]|nr:molybdopterin-dependent oxidoreductase [Acidobacteriota bacterium]